MKILNTKGQSIIQAMVAVAVASIIMMVMLSITSNQARETKALAEKVGAIELSRVVTSALVTTQSCSSLFDISNVSGGLTSFTFDSTAVSPTNPAVFELLKIPSFDGETPIVSPTVPLSSLTNSLMLAPTQGLRVEVVGPNSANLIVNFDGSRLIRSIQPLKFPLRLSTSGDATATVITGCSNQDQNLLANICTSFGGTLDSSGKCTLPSYTSNCSGPPPNCSLPTTCGSAARAVCSDRDWTCICE